MTLTVLRIFQFNEITPQELLKFLWGYLTN